MLIISFASREEGSGTPHGIGCLRNESRGGALTQSRNPFDLQEQQKCINTAGMKLPKHIEAAERV